jgi:hypothetical protein
VERVARAERAEMEVLTLGAMMGREDSRE